jgi:dolichol-phosphate mannosyltransferase
VQDMLSIVVPVYNEAENIRSWWETAKPHLPAGTQVRIVFDHDDDTTIPVAKVLMQEGAPMELVRNHSRGALQAMLTGLRHVNHGAVVVSMADGCDDFSTLGPMLEAWRNGATVVVASRFMPGGRMLGGPWLKGQLSRWGARSLYSIANFPVRDATNNFRLYDASFVSTTTVESKGGFELAFELTFKAWSQGKSVVEVPTTWRDRVHGTSRFKLMEWMPHYAKWWGLSFRHGISTR